MAVPVERFSMLHGNRLASEDRLIRDYSALEGYPVLVMEDKPEGPVVRAVGMCQGINEAAKTVSVFIVSQDILILFDSHQMAESSSDLEEQLDPRIVNGLKNQILNLNEEIESLIKQSMAGEEQIQNLAQQVSQERQKQKKMHYDTDKLVTGGNPTVVPEDIQKLHRQIMQQVEELADIHQKLPPVKHQTQVYDSVKEKVEHRDFLQKKEKREADIEKLTQECAKLQHTLKQEKYIMQKHMAEIQELDNNIFGVKQELRQIRTDKLHLTQDHQENLERLKSGQRARYRTQSKRNLQTTGIASAKTIQERIERTNRGTFGSPYYQFLDNPQEYIPSQVDSDGQSEQNSVQGSRKNFRRFTDSAITSETLQDYGKNIKILHDVNNLLQVAQRYRHLLSAEAIMSYDRKHQQLIASIKDIRSKLQHLNTLLQPVATSARSVFELAKIDIDMLQEMRRAPGNLQKTTTEALGNLKMVALAKSIHRSPDFVESLKALAKSAWNNPLSDI